MNRDQTQNKEKKDREKAREGGGPATGDKNKEHKANTEKHSSKSRTVLGEINDDPKEKSK